MPSFSLAPVILPGSDGLADYPTLPAGSPPLAVDNAFSFNNTTNEAGSPPTPYDANAGVPSADLSTYNLALEVSGLVPAASSMKPAAAPATSTQQTTQAQAASKGLPIVVLLGVVVVGAALLFWKGR